MSQREAIFSEYTEYTPGTKSAYRRPNDSGRNNPGRAPNPEASRSTDNTTGQRDREQIRPIAERHLIILSLAATPFKSRLIQIETWSDAFNVVEVKVWASRGHSLRFAKN